MEYIDSQPGRDEWDSYLNTNGQASFSHLYGWSEALANTYSLPLFRLAVRDKRYGDTITGVLPLMLFAVPDSERRLISLPYSDAAGIVADTASAARILLEGARTIAAEQHAVHLELRQRAGKDDLLTHMFAEQEKHTPHSFKVGLSLQLPDESDTLWQQLPAKVRNQVRKARKSECRVEIGGVELLDDFYAVFSENMRDLGSPVHARELFAAVAEELPDNIRISVVYVGNAPAASSIVFRCNDTLHNPWASSLRKFRPLCPNMLLYWAMLTFGCETDCSRFDFGRSSPGASTCRFKQQWGAEMEQLTWHVMSSGGESWDPKSERLEYDWWKQLSLAESRQRGPALRRWISL